MSSPDPTELSLAGLINTTVFEPPARRQIRSSRSTRGFVGESPYTSRMRGSGMDLDSIGLFQDGDDPRHIDWSATARTGRAHVRRFLATNHRPVTLLADLRASMFFGTQAPLLAARACLQIAGLSAHLLRRRAPFTLVAFDDSGTATPDFRPASRSARIRAQSLADLHLAYQEQLTQSQSPRPRVSLEAVLPQVFSSIPFHNDIVVVSDFSEIGAALQKTIALRRPYSVQGMIINDPVFNGHWQPGLYPARVATDSASRAFRLSAGFAKTQQIAIAQWRTALLQRLLDAGLGYVWESRTDSHGPRQ